MEPCTTRQFNFLVADDSDFARKSIIKVLLNIGGRLAGEAVDGQEAVRMYEELRPDLLFLDITMPGMEGIDTLDRILQKDRSAKVIMVSSLSHQSLVKAALNRGAKHFITKPVQNAPMAEIVKFVLEH